MFKLRPDYAKVKKGMVFGKRTVIGVPFEMRVFSNRYPLGRRRIMCVLECECGHVALVHIKDSKNQSCKSCGLVGNTRGLVHGNHGKPLYSVWYGMNRRCRDLSNKDYGGRGIRVCDEWRDSYEAFEAWAFGNGFRKGLEIDRIDNDGNYEPGNCRWVTGTTNARNRSNNTPIEAFGEKKLLIEWINDERCKVNRDTLMYRLRRGYSPEFAMSNPALPKSASRRLLRGAM